MMCQTVEIRKRKKEKKIVNNQGCERGETKGWVGVGKYYARELAAERL